MTNLTSSLTLRLVDDVSKPARTVAQALKDAEKNVKSVSKAMAGTGASSKFVADLSKLSLARRDIKSVASAWKDYAKSAGLAADSTLWTKTQLAGVKAWESRTIGALRRVKAEQRTFAKSLAGLGPGATAGGLAGMVRSDKFRAGATEAASRLSPGMGYLIGAGGAVAAGAAIGGTAVAGIGAGAMATREAIARDKALADIRKKVNLGAGQTVGDVSRSISDVSRATGMSYEQAAGIFAQGGQGNIAAQDLEKFALLGAKVSTAWDIGAREAAQMLTEVKAQTRWTIPQLEQFADKVNFLGDISAAAEKDIGSMWQRASAGAKAAGVTYDDSLVAMTALRSVGMQDEVAARFFGQFSSRLRAAGAQSKEAKKAFVELGTSAEKLENGMKTDAMGTMIDFLDRLGKHKDSVKIATAIGGKEWFDELLRAKDALSEFIRLRQALAGGGANGSLQQALDIDLSTTEAKLNRAKQAVIDIMAEMAKPALPWLNVEADKLISTAESMARATENARIVDKARSGAPLTDDEARRVAADPTLRGQFNSWARPQGRSISKFESDVGLNRRPAGRAMFSQIEAATPHINTTQITQTAAAGAAGANDLYAALQQLNTTVTPSVDTGVVGQLNAIESAAKAADSALTALQKFGSPGALPAPPTAIRSFDSIRRGSYSAAGDPAGK